MVGRKVAGEAPPRPEDQVEAAVRRVFPQAKAGRAFGMPGWTIPVPTKLVPKDFKGTMDPKNAYVCMRRGASGFTLHVWNPADYAALERHRAQLEAAGLQVMVGCVRWTKKSAFPIEEIEKLLRGMKARLSPKRN